MSHGLECPVADDVHRAAAHSRCTPEGNQVGRQSPHEVLDRIPYRLVKPDMWG